MIAREIKTLLLNEEEKYKHEYYLGRTHEREFLEHLLSSLSGDRVRIFGIQGLPGVGRRTFLKNQFVTYYRFKEL